MKKLIFIVILMYIASIQLFSQPKPRILGVVMGISKYQNVPSLRYADRDAMSFYNFLLSPAGGGADTNNIRLLLNEKATSYNFFEAMDNLLDMAKEGDQVYIYFAGHGDIEKKTDRQNGFLIGSNAPSNCYAAGGCIGVRYLQDYVETLVATKKSKVIMIIDACRSGKLAGGSQGAEITALALQAEWKGVTKILSCQPGETSLEGEQWGGGAGVFTYFMLKGMLGQADKDGDGIVSLMELNNFLDENVLKETNRKQLPSIVGDKRQDIIKVDKKHALALLNQMEKPISLPPENQSAGFEADISSIIDISVLKEYEKFKYYVNNNNLIAYNDADKDKETALSIYRSLEKSRSAQPILNKMKGELLAALQNKAQIIMNGWIEGYTVEDDPYYDSFEELITAYNLVDSTSSQANQIKYRVLYWSQLIERDINKKIKILKECIRTNPDEPFAYLSLGDAYQNTNNLDMAIVNYDKALELSKNWVWPMINKGIALNDLKKYDEAVKYYDRALELKPDNSLPWYNKGNVYNDLKKPDEAIKCFDKAIEIKPDYYKAWSKKGLALCDIGKPVEGLNCINKAIEIKPDFMDSWLNKGILLNKIGKYEDAIICFDKSLDIDQDNYIALVNKGIALYNYGKYNDALDCLNKSLEIKPYCLEALSNKGVILSRIGRDEEAINCYEKALEINLNIPDIWINKGNALIAQKKYDLALICNDKAIKIDSNYYISWFSKGYTCHLQKKFEEAIICYKKALELNPNEVLANYNLSCVYSILKNKTEMLKYLKKTIELDPKKSKADAKKDEDFKEYWNDPDFLELVK